MVIDKNIWAACLANVSLEVMLASKRASLLDIYQIKSFLDRLILLFIYFYYSRCLRAWGLDFGCFFGSFQRNTIFPTILSREPTL